MRMKQVAIVVALAFLLSLPGCGGGGSPASTSSSGGQQGCTSNCPSNHFLFATGQDQIMSFKIDGTTGGIALQVSAIHMPESVLATGSGSQRPLLVISGTADSR